MNVHQQSVHRALARPKQRGRLLPTTASYRTDAHPWRPSLALDEWVKREARPISLSQMMFYGRKLTKDRILLGANYVREELPTRIAHRLRDMQTLPYKVVTNKNWLHVYKLYEAAFDKFRRIPEIRSLQENDAFCKVIDDMLKQHMTVIPSLVIGVIEVRNLMDAAKLDSFTSTMLRSRISRRILAEQHIALTKTFQSASSKSAHGQGPGHAASVLRMVNANEVVQRCAEYTRKLMAQSCGHFCKVPDVQVRGDITATFPYPIAHLEYIVGELLRNSIQAAIENTTSPDQLPAPIDVLICQNPQQAIIRICDQAGGISQPTLEHLWSFSKGPHQGNRLMNLNRVPKLVATMADMEPLVAEEEHHLSSLSSLSNRPPDLRLGIGLPMSRIYAQFWAGNLTIHSLEGYGTDAFLEISKLGNKNEHITTRATVDAV